MITGVWIYIHYAVVKVLKAVWMEKQVFKVTTFQN